MKKISILSLIVAVSFGLGFLLSSFLYSGEATQMKKVTGIGGIFFKAKDPAKLREWYKKNLGLVTNDYGSVFEWRQADAGTQKGYTQWSPFKETTKYFAPSTKEFMINYRVENLIELQKLLKADGVSILDTIESVEYGKFLHIMDLEGNKIELWEPKDNEFSKISNQTTK